MFYGSDNFSVGVGLSIASPSHHSARYMSDQTFHTPNFGDEEFDLPPIIPQPGDHSHMQGNMTYTMGMHGVPDQQGQPHYTSMYLPEHMSTPMTIHSPVTYGGSPPTYTTLSSPHAPSPSQVGGNPHLMHHPQTGARPQMQPMIPPGSAPPGRSPTNSASPANAETGSEDSDDSVPVSQLQVGVKRPSPEPGNTQPTNIPAPVVVKKPKPQKKKKKRDPNEPNKPVSAYALFFRDTQAAIKGQNPNASFGEVSKIVASMWDALDAEHKNVYKKKTEAAKKEYLKALAAYRASLVSKGAPTDSADGSGMYPPPNFNANISSSQHYQSHSQQGQSYYTAGQGGQGAGKKSQQQAQQSSQQTPAPPSQTTGPPQPTSGMPPPPTQTQPQHSPVQQPSQQQPPHQATHQQMMQQMPGSHHIDSNQYGGMRPTQGYMSTMGDTSHSHGMGMTGGMHHLGGHGQMVTSGPVMSHMGSDGHDHSQRQMCVRNGCNNMAITSPEWENEYCSSDCVVTHCRDVFTNWVSTNQPGNPNYGNGVK